MSRPHPNWSERARRALLAAQSRAPAYATCEGDEITLGRLARIRSYLVRRGDRGVICPVCGGRARLLVQHRHGSRLYVHDRSMTEGREWVRLEGCYINRRGQKRSEMAIFQRVGS